MCHPTGLDVNTNQARKETSLCEKGFSAQVRKNLGFLFIRIKIRTSANSVRTGQTVNGQSLNFRRHWNIHRSHMTNLINKSCILSKYKPAFMKPDWDSFGGTKADTGQIEFYRWYGCLWSVTPVNEHHTTLLYNITKPHTGHDPMRRLNISWSAQTKNDFDELSLVVLKTIPKNYCYE